MVVLSASICTKNGKAIVARQFVPMTRLRVEGLLSAFPKLIGVKSEHTYVETEYVRYIYQPMEDLYLLIITNKQSNIMEDLETLRLLATLVPVYCHNQTAESISDHAFDLIFAFDEVVSAGYKEHVDVDKVRKFTTMDSHDEKLERILRENKEQDALAVARLKEREFQRNKEERPGMYGGAGGSSRGGSKMPMDSFNSSDSMRPSEYTPYQPKSKKKRAGRSRDAKPKGLTLGSPSAATDDLPAAPVVKLGQRRNRGANRSAASRGGGAPVMESGETIQVEVEEKISAEFERDGNLKSMQIAGSIFLNILDPDHARVRLLAESSKAKGFRFGLHPVCDKQAWAREKAICRKDSQPFDVQSRFKLGQYKMKSDDESKVPLLLSFWPSEKAGGVTVSAEYQSQLEDIELRDVVISIPCSGLDEEPVVSSVDGETAYERRDGVFNWHISSIPPESSGSLEFSVEDFDGDDFFPIEVSFQCSEDTIYGVNVTKVVDIDTGESRAFDMKKLMIGDKYRMV